MTTLKLNIGGAPKDVLASFSELLDRGVLPSAGFKECADALDSGSLKERFLSASSYELELAGAGVPGMLVGTLTFSGSAFNTTGGIDDPYILNATVFGTRAIINRISLADPSGHDLLVYTGSIPGKQLILTDGQARSIAISGLQVGSSAVGQMVEVKGNLSLALDTSSSIVAGTLSGSISQLSVLVRQEKEAYQLTLNGKLKPTANFLAQFTGGIDGLDGSVTGQLTGMSLSRVLYADSDGQLPATTELLLSATGLDLSEQDLASLLVAAGNELGPDTSFSQDGLAAIPVIGAGSDEAWGGAEAVTLQADGKLLVAGSYRQNLPPDLLHPYGSYEMQFAVTRFNADGTVDKSFSGDGTWTNDWKATLGNVIGVAQLGDGAVIVACRTYDQPPAGELKLIKLSANGALDTGFAAGGTASSAGAYGSAFAAQADGSVFLGGSNTLARFRPDGSVDAAFAQKVPGALLPGTDIKSIVLQGDGKILVGGSENGTLLLARLNEDGTRDDAFTPDFSWLGDLKDAQIQRVAHTYDARGEAEIIALGIHRSASGSELVMARFDEAGGNALVSASQLPPWNSGTVSVRDFRVNADGSLDVVLHANGDHFIGHVIVNDSGFSLENYKSIDPLLYPSLSSSGTLFSPADGSLWMAGITQNQEFSVSKMIDSELSFNQLLLSGNDTLSANAPGDSRLQGFDGHDTITGGGGNDILDGGAGNDSLLGGAGDDHLSAGTGVDTVDGSAGSDTLFLLASFDDYERDRLSETDTRLLNRKTSEQVIVRRIESFTFTDAVKTLGEVWNNAVSSFSDSWTGSNGNDSVNGLGGNDTLSGLAGDDTLDGGAGGDSLAGGAGDDSYYVDNGDDTVDENAGEGSSDEVRSTVSFDLSARGANVERLTLLGSAAINASGNDLDNVLTGNGGANVLDGRAGADTMDGGKGNDTYVVDDEGDLVSETAAQGGGVDSVRSSISFALGGGIENLVLTGTADIGASGNELANAITGNDGKNMLDGGSGIDVLKGGPGDDIYVVDLVRNGSKATLKLEDSVSELAGQGNDTLQLRLRGSIDYGAVSSTTLTLGANLERFDASRTGMLALQLTGNALDNVLSANGADNFLDGGAGADTLSGGDGDDLYVVDNTGDAVAEEAGQGSDTVQVKIAAANGSYALSANVEQAILLNAVAFSLIGNDLDNVLSGNASANTLSGGDGNDTLDGKAGADSLVGGAGDDIYYVDNVKDTVSENAGEGSSDEIRSTVSFDLSARGANVERLTLLGSAAINASGNDLDNVLTGNGGANVLDGRAGADTMDGGKGNDTYVVDDEGDLVSETAAQGGGVDSVRSSISFALGGGIENLVLTGTADIGASGNELANAITGNDGKNMLDGGSGIDVLKGGPGDDIYVVDLVRNGSKATLKLEDSVSELTGQGNDTLELRGSIDYGAVGSTTLILGANLERFDAGKTGDLKLNLTGNTLDNVLTGNAANNVLSGGVGADELLGGGGNDTLIGGVGSDILTGGEGNDIFRIDTPLNAKSNVDSIQDFDSSADVIQLENRIFSKLATGQLLDVNFRAGDAVKAEDSNDYILYDSASGRLFYDADGSGSAAAVQFATLTGHPGLSASNFSIT